MKPVVYQLVLRYFGNTNLTRQKYGDLATNGCGKFSDVSTQALDALKELGVTHLWLTGCLRQATLTAYEGLPADDPDVVKGTAGSFYAVRDYFDVCPDYAEVPANRMREFEELIARAHAAGFRVLLDFVPNHVARGYRSVVRPELSFGQGDDQGQFFSPANHFFYVGAPGESLRLPKPADWNPPGQMFDGHFEPEDGQPGHRPKATGSNHPSAAPGEHEWYETIKLNYGYDFTQARGQYEPRPRTWEGMDEVIAYWQGKGVDGFRCDMAHLVPREFWTFLIGRARERSPEVYFVAEAYFGWGGTDPVQTMDQLIAAGFDAIYHDESFKALRRIYQSSGSQEDYDRQLVAPPIPRERLLEYLENHDELRIPAPVRSGDAGNSGFGSAEAGYQLAPLQFLNSSGPVLLLNGQEVGELGSEGGEGWPVRFGHSTFFDYWAMPHLARWVNGHTYDGGGLSESERNLRSFYAALLALTQDPAVQGSGFWGLKYYNNPHVSPDRPDDLYSFARFAPGGGRLLVVVANFRPSGETTGWIALPQELLDAAGLNNVVEVRHVLGRFGQLDDAMGHSEVVRLRDAGFFVSVPNQTTHVYALATPRN